MWGPLERTDAGGRETRSKAGVEYLRDCLNKMTELLTHLVQIQRRVTEKI